MYFSVLSPCVCVSVCVCVCLDVLLGDQAATRKLHFDLWYI